MSSFSCPPEQRDEEEEADTNRNRDSQFVRRRREDENEAFALDEGRKAGNTKRHEEKAERLPPAGPSFWPATDAEQEGKSDDRGDAQRIEPDGGSRIKMVENRDEIPKQITPKRDPTFGNSGEISEDAHVEV